MNKRDQFLNIVENKVSEHNLSDYVQRSEEFEKGLLVGLESLEEYIKSNYSLKKKRKPVERKVWKPKRIKRCRPN